MGFLPTLVSRFAGDGAILCDVAVTTTALLVVNAACDHGGIFDSEAGVLGFVVIFCAGAAVPAIIFLLAAVAEGI